MDLADVGAHVRRELEGFRDRDGPGACTSRSSPAPSSSPRGRDGGHLRGRGGHRRARATASPSSTRACRRSRARRSTAPSTRSTCCAAGREQRRRSSSWGRAASRATSSRRRPAIPRRSRPRWVPTPADRRPGGGGRRGRLLRGDGHDQLQLLPAGARGHARAATAALAPAPPPPDAGPRSGPTRSSRAQASPALSRACYGIATRPRWSGRSRWAARPVERGDRVAVGRARPHVAVEVDGGRPRVVVAMRMKAPVSPARGRSRRAPRPAPRLAFQASRTAPATGTARRLVGAAGGVVSTGATITAAEASPVAAHRRIHAAPRAPRSDSRCRCRRPVVGERGAVDRLAA